jgi:hypothetical protein
MGVKLRTVKEWLAVVENPPKCCLSCDHYLAHRGEWEETATCRIFNANPPREFVEAENDCQSWAELVPF